MPCSVVGRREDALLGYISNIPRRLVCIMPLAQLLTSTTGTIRSPWSKESVWIDIGSCHSLFIIVKPGEKHRSFSFRLSRESRRTSTHLLAVNHSPPPSPGWENTFRILSHLSPPDRTCFSKFNVCRDIYFIYIKHDEFIYLYIRETMKITIPPLEYNNPSDISFFQRRFKRAARYSRVI